MTKTVTRPTDTLTTDYHKYDKWFMIAKALLVFAPFVALSYLEISAGSGSLALLLQQDPRITVTFLASMAGPFTAYLLGFAQNHLYEGEPEYMMAHLSLLLVTELLLRNTIYLIMMLYLMYLVYRMTGMSPLSSLRAKWKNHFFRDLSGCFLLILFGSSCLFVSLRLGL